MNEDKEEEMERIDNLRCMEADDRNDRIRLETMAPSVFSVNAPCVRTDGDCLDCDMWNGENCCQDNDFGGTGHGELSMSDADPGL